MELVKIDRVRESLINQHTTPAREYQWQSLSKATISRATPTLFDELSIIFDTPDGPVYVTEVDPGFVPLIDALSLDKQLPEDWYVQVEAGAIFTLSLPSSN
ncbi:MAG: hypothetical protein N0C88_21270 [Candidatus Thiodiazotropha lotti]|uniref:Uncharacterized protein n=1 Tax=Candidatus Thiodiazotropha lotti TaxID=2792787 RepID=A0A9E4K7N0_9GAMM|nr:hypothetical protein [Candidatus Thiodiazotropha lotti]MCG7930705.1 hypothetical protein [Candidatus Thiodiazotropha lotti]MCG7941361.1 hypothetical protein [Candidatus Thiodiazotropha lotti]MCG7987145.1 hypothetical protein [Candidatus Thiodiazotropha lotti]MCG8003581.1 hypothetical protein [Candidatus Thiodiazotropha lotti]